MPFQYTNITKTHSNYSHSQKLHLHVFITTVLSQSEIERLPRQTGSYDLRGIQTKLRAL